MQSVVAKLTARLETIQTCGSKNSRVFEGCKCVMAEMAGYTNGRKTGTARLPCVLSIAISSLFFSS